MLRHQELLSAGPAQKGALNSMPFAGAALVGLRDVGTGPTVTKGPGLL